MNNVRKLWENSNISGRCPGLASSVRYDEPMSAHTTFRIGGPADFFAVPATTDELAAVIEFFSAHSVPVSILGGGSNLLVSDRGIRGAVLSLESLSRIALSSPDPAALPPRIRSGAGASMKMLTEWCAHEGFSGLERFAGLPGSVGGAVFMNARCYEISVSDLFFTADVLHFARGGCTIETAAYNPEEWSYKKSPFQDRPAADTLLVGEDTRIVLSAVFTVSRRDSGHILAEMDRYIQDREEKGHFRFPSAGSMFKNNHAYGKPSGKIIDEAGLRGFRIGDAQVAPWHGNIVINAGNARADDMRKLVEEIRNRVYTKTGFDLEPEVIIAGDWQQF